MVAPDGALLDCDVVVVAEDMPLAAWAYEKVAAMMGTVGIARAGACGESISGVKVPAHPRLVFRVARRSVLVFS